MWHSPTVDQYEEGVAEETRQTDVDSLEEARCNALVQSARYLEKIRRYHDRNVKERSFNVGGYWPRLISSSNSRRRRSRQLLEHRPALSLLPVGGLNNPLQTATAVNNSYQVSSTLSRQLWLQPLKRQLRLLPLVGDQDNPLQTVSAVSSHGFQLRAPVGGFINPLQAVSFCDLVGSHNNSLQTILYRIGQ